MGRGKYYGGKWDKWIAEELGEIPRTNPAKRKRAVKATVSTYGMMANTAMKAVRGASKPTRRAPRRRTRRRVSQYRRK